MNSRKSIYIRQWSWERLDVSIWRNGAWTGYGNVTPSSRTRLRKLTEVRAGRFATRRADLGISCMTLWANEYEEPRPEPAPDIDPADEFFSPNLEPDPNQAYYDFRETMDDFVESTRS